MHIFFYLHEHKMKQMSDRMKSETHLLSLEKKNLPFIEA